MNKIILAYVGLDPLSLRLLLEAESIDVRYVNTIDEFSSMRGFSPVNYLYVLCYRAIMRKQWTCARFLFQCFCLTSVVASRLYRNYKDYLELLLNSRPELLDVRDTEHTARVLSSGVDVLVVNNWWILPEEIVYAPQHKAINIHPSRLPQYRGSLPTLWSLKHRDTESAVSFMVLDTAMDTGGILAQIPFSIDAHDNALDVEDKVEAIVRTHLVSIIRRYVAGEIEPQKQDDSTASTTAKYYPYMKVRPSTEKARNIRDKVLVYPYLWPEDCCYLELRGRQVPLQGIEIADSDMKPVLERGCALRCGTRLYVQADECLVIRLFSDIDVSTSLWLLAQLNKKQVVRLQ